MNVDVSRSFLKDQIGEFIKAAGERAPAEVVNTLRPKSASLSIRGLPRNRCMSGPRHPTSPCPRLAEGARPCPRCSKKGP